jgi:hypothetical protein
MGNKMINSWSGYLPLAVFLTITAIGSILWVGGLMLIWLFSQVIGLRTDLWAMVEALSTAIAAIAVIGAGFFAYRELSEISSSRHMQVADKLFNELNSQENIEARRWVFLNLPENPKEGIKSITIEGQIAVKKVLNSLDHVAFLTQSGWIPDEIIMPWMHPMIMKSWNKLESYIIYERQRRNEPYYYEHAEELAERCRRWRESRLSENSVNWVDSAL